MSAASTWTSGGASAGEATKSSWAFLLGRVGSGGQGKAEEAGEQAGGDPVSVHHQRKGLDGAGREALTHPTSLRASQRNGRSKLKLLLAEISKYCRFLLAFVSVCSSPRERATRGHGRTSCGGR